MIKLSEHDKYIITKNIYNLKQMYEIFIINDLPMNGWIQSCIFCNIFTSKTITLFGLNVSDSKEALYEITCDHIEGYTLG